MFFALYVHTRFICYRGLSTGIELTSFQTQQDHHYEEIKYRKPPTTQGAEMKEQVSSLEYSVISCAAEYCLANPTKPQPPLPSPPTSPTTTSCVIAACPAYGVTGAPAPFAGVKGPPITPYGAAGAPSPSECSKEPVYDLPVLKSSFHTTSTEENDYEIMNSVDTLDKIS